MAAVGEAPQHRHTVLVVEDFDDARECLTLLIEVEGHRAIGVRGAVEALHMMVTLGLRPCVIVADLLLIGIDGLVFHAAMERYDEIAGIPTIALTGHEGLRRKAIDEGFAAALLKPCTAEVLFESLDRCCQKWRSAPGTPSRSAAG
jgi:DNA-binding NtrC family response regulator